MLQIDKAIISSDLFKENFLCDLNKCKGVCCIYGESGAPLDPEEADILDNIYEKIRPFLRPESVVTINKYGTSVIDKDGDIVTPLIEDKECVYVYFDNDIAKCSIEKAYYAGVMDFKKPLSCHLYPVRITKYAQFDAVNCHKCNICQEAFENGRKSDLPLYVFLKEALTRKYGEEWYRQLCSAHSLLKGN
jgi:hypothetical protein